MISLVRRGRAARVSLVALVALDEAVYERAGRGERDAASMLGPIGERLLSSDCAWAPGAHEVIAAMTAAAIHLRCIVPCPYLSAREAGEL
jgi:hypothetical protein